MGLGRLCSRHKPNLTEELSEARGLHLTMLSEKLNGKYGNRNDCRSPTCRHAHWTKPIGHASILPAGSLLSGRLILPLEQAEFRSAA